MSYTAELLNFTESPIIVNTFSPKTDNDLVQILISLEERGLGEAALSTFLYTFLAWEERLATFPTDGET